MQLLTLKMGERLCRIDRIRDLSAVRLRSGEDIMGPPHLPLTHRLLVPSGIWSTAFAASRAPAECSPERMLVALHGFAKDINAVRGYEYNAAGLLRMAEGDGDECVALGWACNVITSALKENICFV